MSYLLKALEKAEQERQHNVNTEQGEPVVIQQTSSLPIGLVCLIVAVLLLTLWQVWPDQAQNHHASAAEETLAQESVALIGDDVAFKKTQVRAADTVEKPSTVEVHEPVMPEPKDLSELTAVELKRIPSLNLASHIYSSAAEFRSVVINDQTYKEGALIQAGLKLETINQNGIVINIHGQRVELPKGISWVASQDAK